MRRHPFGPYDERIDPYDTPTTRRVAIAVGLIVWGLAAPVIGVAAGFLVRWFISRFYGA